MTGLCSGAYIGHYRRAWCWVELRVASTRAVQYGAMALSIMSQFRCLSGCPLLCSSRRVRTN